MYVFDICYGAVDLFIILNISVNVSAGSKKNESHLYTRSLWSLLSYCSIITAV